jgi:hypothetical protein
MEVVLQ